MKKLKRLPDAEFEIMKVVWANEPPITTNMIMDQLGNARGWKAPTAITLLLRLVERGYIRTEKNGKERVYYPLIEKDEYLQFETGNFLKVYHENSFVSFVSSMFEGKNVDKNDIDELLNWAKERK
jgi:predicted transcriptional regulator